MQVKVRLQSSITNKIDYVMASEEEIKAFKKSNMFVGVDRFTGIYDKFGNEVYEKDIIKFGEYVGFVTRSVSDDDYYIINAITETYIKFFDVIRLGIGYMAIGNMNKNYDMYSRLSTKKC